MVTSADGDPPDQAPRQPTGPSRRTVLRAMGAVGAAAGMPIALGACEPVTTPMPLAPDPSVRGLGFLGGPEVQVGQGGWCWFQSPRASVGPGGVLWLGSTVSNTFTDLDGSIQATALDTTTMTVREQRTVAKDRLDDHTSPSVLALGDEVQISWALHRQVNYLDVGETAVGQPFRSQRIVRPGSLTAPARGMSYCSVHVVQGERWLLYRGESYSWNLLTSPDGVTWTARGLIVRPGVSGQRPYVHAASDGTRLYVVVNDGNPSEYRGTSIYAGAIGAAMNITDAAGAPIGSVGSGAPRPSRFTKIVAGSLGALRADDTNGWSCDLKVVDRQPTGIVSVRDPWPEGSPRVGNYRHRYLWIRRRSTGWLVEPLCWAGGELYATQPDYTGLAAQDPSEPKRVVVSTNVHPVTGEPLVSASDGLVHWELFQGYRVAEGQWSWTPITEHSIEDNIRPTIAAGGATKALAWMRGRYWTWAAFNTRIVVRRATSAT